MKTLSLKIIVLFVAVSATFVSCKKLDGPEPSAKEYLTSRTWTAYAYKDVASGITIPIVPGQCNDFVVQFASNGAAYHNNGCSTTNLVQDGFWTIVDKTVILSDGSTFIIDQINAQNMTITTSGGKSDVVIYF